MKHDKKKSTTTWNPSDLPFATNYNDHFETPLQAYVDIKPVIDWLFTSLNVNSCSSGSSDKKVESISVSSRTSGTHVDEKSYVSSREMRIYDPYYCNGRVATLLKQIGYDNIVHEKRDFYADISNDSVPGHDILITNPPFSDSHKTKCLNYCFRKLSQSGGTDDVSRNPFLLLMPTYVASKHYYSELLTCSMSQQVVYLIPSTSYKYDHPENTGKEYCPFESLWYFGMPRDQIGSFQKYWQSLASKTNRLTLATSVDQLKTMGVISTHNRLNPKQRNRIRKRLEKDDKDVVSKETPENHQNLVRKRKRRF